MSFGKEEVPNISCLYSFTSAEFQLMHSLGLRALNKRVWSIFAVEVSSPVSPFSSSTGKVLHTPEKQIVVLWLQNDILSAV